MVQKYGFILTRHVNNEKTNCYWNQSVKLIRRFYPRRLIVVIDDNSNKEFVKPDTPYKNILVIQSEYPGRGELLPYVYFLRYGTEWFKNAVIIHDSIFFHKHILFETFKYPVIPIWHHAYDKENVTNLVRIASYLKNNSLILNKIHNDELTILGMNKNKHILCFGCQSYINHTFLQSLEAKYNITNLVNAVHNRTDRCGLERILGIIFSEEFINLINKKSLFGDIMIQPNAFNYTYDQYMRDIKENKQVSTVVKVWTGR